RITPTRRLTMANTISAVTVTFGTALRRRSMGVEHPAGKRLATMVSGLEALDFIPQSTVLRLVGRPYLLLRYLAELVDVGLDHGHADWLKQRFGLGVVIDGLGLLADFLLRGARQFENQFLLIGCQPVPDIEIHHGIGRAVIVIGEGG